MQQDLTQTHVPHCGIAALVGRANAGKSTLVNAMLEEKISIVSPVVQTTRHLVRGVLTEPRGQLVFLDTPGVHHAGTDLGRLMNTTARRATEGVDVVVLVLDSHKRPSRLIEDWMRRLQQSGQPVVAVLNKQDLGEGHAATYQRLWLRMSEETGTEGAVAWRTVSALSGEGVPELVGELFDRMPSGPLLFPADVLTDFPRRLALSDLVREQYNAVLLEELPHAIAVAIDDLDERADGSWHCRGTVYVAKASQKGIVLGSKGRLLRRVQRAAEREASRLYDRPVHLKLWVRIEKDWQRNFWLLQRFGYRP